MYWLAVQCVHGAKIQPAAVQAHNMWELSPLLPKHRCLVHRSQPALHCSSLCRLVWRAALVLQFESRSDMLCPGAQVAAECISVVENSLWLHLSNMCHS